MIVGVYDLVDRKNGKTLRYPDPLMSQPDPYEPPPTMTEEGFNQPPTASSPLTTEGNGTPIEYDFIGTGFYVGSGFIVSNRHVLQPWEEDDLVKQLIKQANAKPRIKRLAVYFPSFPQAFPLKIRQIGSKEDLGIASIDPNLISSEIPTIPVDTSNDSVTIGKTVVTMGYPNGPDRILATLGDEEVRKINERFGNSKQNLLNYLAQNNKITPLQTRGTITDLDSRRVVHDAKTAEGSEHRFGQSGRLSALILGYSPKVMPPIWQFR